MGGVSYVTGAPAPISWVAASPTQHVWWHRDELEKLAEKTTAIEFAIQELLGRGLSQHLLNVTSVDRSRDL